MRTRRLFKSKISKRLHMFGDCSRCGHSIAYHVPLVGCAKCRCDEFH